MNAHSPLSISVMGILNVTPDSFSGDGLMSQNDVLTTALQQASHMIQEGATILDIGGESTRPGHTPISADEEIRRVIPVISALQETFPTITISIDTFKAPVAEAALAAGASIINDITALKGDALMAKVATRFNCHIILMDNRSDTLQVTRDHALGDRYKASSDSPSIVEEVIFELKNRISVAQQAGIHPDKIILDPGIGFGKSTEQNLDLLRNLPKIKSLGYPVLIAPSRKSFIGQILHLPVGERLEGTAAAVAIATFLGADIVRVHDVQYMHRVAHMAHAIATLKT